MTAAVERDPARLFARAAVQVMRRQDGSQVLRSPMPLRHWSRCVGEWLVHWAQAEPLRPFLQERSASGAWRGVTYSEALYQVRCIATWLSTHGLSADRPLAILSDNSVEHGLLTLAAMHVGIPVVPVSAAYSLMSKDFGKLKVSFSQIDPGAIYIADQKRFAPALAAIRDRLDASVIVGGAGGASAGTIAFDELLCGSNDTAVDRAFNAVLPETLAKILFTSGSTGVPKGVINSQRMLCSNQQAIGQLWPFLETSPPVVVDWLPWNHTFGGNHNFNLVLRNGGTLYIDEGRPAPGLFEQTLGNLREIAPTIYFNVPRGFDMLIGALRVDDILRRTFFSRLQVIFYAAAALPQDLWDALHELARQTVGAPVPLVSSWGSTETAPAATNCYFQADHTGVIGLPVPGTELKLVPSGNKLEVRVRGPNVTPGYWRQPESTAAAFDSEGFYSIGDAVRLVDEAHPEKGLLFDGRVSEDFKLSTGTWVSVGALRVKAITALAPVAQDIVLTGHNTDSIGMLIFPNIAACRQLCPDLQPTCEVAQVLSHPTVRARVRAGMTALQSEGGGSSTYATAALLMAEPPSIDGGEITDKGYINQRAVLERRALLVRTIEAQPAHPELIRMV
jgi:feruloyl-CoA synthase